MASIYDKGTSVRLTPRSLKMVYGLIRKIQKDERRPVKNPEVVAKAIRHYYKTVFPSTKKRAKA